MTSPALVVRFAPDDREARDLAAAALLDVDTAAVHEIHDNEWRVFFRSGDERDRAATVLRAYGDVTPLDLEAEDWARRSQERLKAIRVGDLVIAPPWDADRPETLNLGPRTQQIVIEPSTGFGTGHHATTRLCLRALQRIDVRGKSVIDAGTGSGVLAIAAAKLGAERVVAVEDDPDAIAAARANAARNGAAISFVEGDVRTAPMGRADVVVANLTGAVLQREASVLASAATGGTIILSGMLAEEAPAVGDAFRERTATARREDEDGWSCLTLRLR